MKHARSKFVAAVMAAITTFSAAQALNASALDNAYRYTMWTQSYCEDDGWMSTNIGYWRNQSLFRPGTTWGSAGDVMCGYVAKTGFQKGTYSGIYMGNNITGSAALVRRLANDYFNNCHVSGHNNHWENGGCPAYLEHRPNARYFQAQLGDQFRLINTSTGAVKWAFVTHLPSDSTNWKLKTIELSNNKVTYDVAYTSQVSYLSGNGGQWKIDCYLRPIKQGDANGDGVVSPVEGDPRTAGSDLAAITQYAQQLPSSAYYEVELLKAACSLDNNDRIDGADWMILQNNLVAQRDPNEYNNFRMEGLWYYVQRPCQ